METDKMVTKNLEKSVEHTDYGEGIATHFKQNL